MDKKVAREIGAALGLVKSGAVERVEAQNAAMVKVANAIHRLYKKGKLKKGSKMEKMAVDWGSLAAGGLAGGAGGAGLGALLGLAGGPFAPITIPMGMGLGALFGGGTGAGLSQLGGGGRAAPTAMGETPEFSPQQLEWMKARGWDPAAGEAKTKPTPGAPAAAAAKKSPWGGTDEEFYTEQPGTMREMYMKYLGQTPGQMMGRQSAMLGGLGRARQAAETNRWLRAMTGAIV